ncbi:MAG TPA: DinB family protein [Frankiaceae bacterium]|nr:DinB family protein [Frankiaceae bacterium]
MPSFGRSDDLTGAEFADTSLRRARFVGVDLSGAVLRGVAVRDVEVESPWLFEGGTLRVNGIDVVPLVDAELDRHFPGRAERNAADPAGLRSAWAAVEAAWAPVMERAAAMPPGAVDARVGGEWSFAQTLRHLVMATDVWLRKAVLRIERPFHPLGLAGPGAEEEGLDMSVFATGTPTYAEVLDARAERVAMMRDHLARVTPEELDEPRPNPWAPQYQDTVRSCLHVVIGEEWEHLRYAVRDLDALAAAPGGPGD